MGNINWTLLCIYGGFIALALVFVVPILVIASAFGKLLKKETEEQQAKEEAYRQSIRDNGGLLEFGKVIDAKVIHSPSKRQHGNPFIIDFEIEITPENSPAFKTKFREKIVPNGYNIILVPTESDPHNRQMVSEYGKKVVVMYDPTNPSRAYFDIYDLDNYRSPRMIWRF